MALTGEHFPGTVASWACDPGFDPELARQAFALWDPWVELDFREVPYGAAEITIGWEPIDGAGGTLGRCTWHYDASSHEVLDVRIILDPADADEMNQLSVLEHEIGHAPMGLTHDPDWWSVMYPYNHETLQLHNVNITDIQGLYGPDSGDNLLNGSNFDDAILGGAGNDTILGNAGHDAIQGGTGNDALYGGDHNDQLFGQDGDDELGGGNGSDVLGGGSGRDEIFGGDGDDVIYGGAGADTVYAGGDDDLIYGGDGADLIFGGAGNDTIDVRGGGTDTVYGGDGLDEILAGPEDIVYYGDQSLDMLA
ncbi:matrixin family metalloprotease [Afifella sp. YEN Y35]|uniref:matrixin family metalloprotease n=1 Tax=Afifella sp. YEN Y35 TaxID=3388337 RepID=UPI0039E19311